MWFVIVVASVVVSYVVAMEVSLRRHGFRPRQPLSHRAPGYRFRWTWRRRGGARIRWADVPWPLVQLEADTEWIHFGWPVSIWISRSELSGILPVKGPFGPGLRFATFDGDTDGVIFWTWRPCCVLLGLEQLGWPVDRLPVHLHARIDVPV